MDITLQNNSIAGERDGEAVVKLFDKDDNEVGSKLLSNVRLAAEERKSQSVSFDGVTNAVRAEVTYRKSTSGGTADTSASALKFDGIPAALSDFVKKADGTYHASATVERLAQTLVTVTAQDPNAKIMLGGEAIGTGSGAKTVALSEGENTITVTITAGGQSTTYVLSCTVTDSRAAQELTAADVTGTYGDTTKKIELQGNAVGKVSYTVKSGADVAAVDENGTLTFRKAGSAVVTVAAAGDSTHRPWTKDVAITVQKAKVTIRAADKQLYTGDTAPDMDTPVLGTDYTLTGLIGEDTLESGVSVKLTCDKPLDMNTAGEYVLTPVVSGTDSRYDFKVEPGKLTVTKRNTSSGGNSSGSVKPTPNPAPEDELNFIDVPKDSYFEEAVRWAVKKGITNGTSANTFSPDASCTRAQIVTFLWRAAGSPEPERMSSFTDVSASAYYAKAVAWAVEHGITVGTSDTTFSPEQICTRAHGVTFLYRAAKANVDSGSTAFTDVNENAYYAKAVRWAVDNGITNGISKSLFGPENSCTRAQIVTFLWRLYAEQ